MYCTLTCKIALKKPRLECVIKSNTVQCTVYTDVLYCQQYLYCTVHTAGKLYELSVGKGRGPVLEYRYAEKYHEH